MRGRRYTHRWFVLYVGDELACEMEAKMSDAARETAEPSVEGLLEELRPNLVYGLQLAFGMQHSDAGDLWVAWGAVQYVEALWPLVAERGWPSPKIGGRGLREGWLRRLDSRFAEALRAEVEERTEEAFCDLPNAELAAALAGDAIDTGVDLLELGDERGKVVRAAGERFNAHLRQLDDVYRSWAPVGEAIAAVYGCSSSRRGERDGK